jgi:phosphopantothenoylcysteine synthetase/decarboxylase
VKFVVTAGPTREPLDPVRYLSNRSSGKMGYAIAAAALEEKHEVVLISGPVALNAPAGAELVPVTTGEEMFAAISKQLRLCDVLVMCAAVCDYKPLQSAARKLPKQRGRFSLELEPTRDILASLTNKPNDCLVVGFAAETHELAASAERKLREKNCDLIIANDVSRADVGMDAEENEVIIFSPNDAPKKIPRAKKSELARVLLKIILNAREKRLTKKS